MHRWGHHKFIPFVHAFYSFEYPLFYSHHNCEGEVIVTQFAMGTRQGDPFGRALFVLAHFKTLQSITNHSPPFFFHLL
jgi:hypothetical protein